MDNCHESHILRGRGGNNTFWGARGFPPQMWRLKPGGPSQETPLSQSLVKARRMVVKGPGNETSQGAHRNTRALSDDTRPHAVLPRKGDYSEGAFIYVYAAY